MLRLALAQRAVEKANRVLSGEAQLAEPFAAWAAPHLNNGGLPTAPKDQSAAWAAAARLLTRARGFLLAMSEQRRAGMHWKDGRFQIVWIEQTMPPALELKRLLHRARLTLELAETEIAQGEHQKEPPRCQR